MGSGHGVGVPFGACVVPGGALGTGIAPIEFVASLHRESVAKVPFAPSSLLSASASVGAAPLVKLMKLTYASPGL